MLPASGVRENRFNIIGIAQRLGGSPRVGLVAKMSAAGYVNRTGFAMGYGDTSIRRLATRLAGIGTAGRALAVALVLTLPLAGCFSETYQKGYVVPEGALEQIPIGASQEQVLILMGTPSTV